MGISPLVLSWMARDQERARIKALKDAADPMGSDSRQAAAVRVRARLLEAKVELEQLNTLRRTV